MQILDNADLAFLAILAWPKLTSKMLRIYAGGNTLFNMFAYPHIATMVESYISLLKCSRDTGITPSKDQITADLSESLQSAMIPEDMYKRAELILTKYSTGDIPTEEEGWVQIRKIASREATRKLGALITLNPDFTELEKSLNISKKVISDLDNNTSTDGSRQFVFNPFADIKKLIKQLPRIPTGINWLDQSSHGGAREGECWLILGPSGGGKSTIAVDMSCAQAIMGNYAVWVTYEQTLYGDLAERMIANVTDTSLDDIRDRGYDGLSEDVRDKFDNVVSGVRDKLICLDMAQFDPDKSDPEDIGGMYSICRRVKEFRDAGKNIKFVIVDWLGSMAARVFARTGGNMKQDFASFVQRTVLEAHDFGEKHGVFFLFFHQTDTEAQQARPIFCPSMTNARDDHGMCFYFDNVFALGRRDQHDICWFNPDKTRKANTRPITLRLIGDKARFELAPGWVPNKDGNFYNVELDNDTDIDNNSQNIASAMTYIRDVE